MKKNKQLMLLMFVAAALVVSSTAATAIEGGGALGEIATELIGGNVITSYNKMPSVFDAILLMILFVGITTFAFKEKFGEQTKLISWSLSIILAIGGTVAFHTIIKSNDSVKQMCEAAAEGGGCGLAYVLAGPAGLIVLFVFGALLFYIINAVTQNKGISFAIAYIFMYSMINSFFIETVKGKGLLYFIKEVPFLYIILMLTFYAMIIYLAYAMIQWIVHLWSQGAGRGMSAAASGIEGTRRGMADMGQAINEGRQERQLQNRERSLETVNERLDGDMQRFANEMSATTHTNEEILDAVENEINQLITYMRQQR